MLRPFDKNEVGNTDPAVRARMREFKKIISSICVRVEQAFGMLKGRFPSLKLFSTPADIRHAYRVFEALADVHNFCINNSDHSENIPRYSPWDEAVEAAIEEVRRTVEVGEYAMDDDSEVAPDEFETPDRLKQLGKEF